MWIGLKSYCKKRKEGMQKSMKEYTKSGRGITEISHEVRLPGCTFSGNLHIILTEEDISSSFETVYTSY